MKNNNEMKKKGAYLVDGKYSFKDLADIERLREIFEKFSLATGYSIGLVSYPEQEILIATGWRDICTKFHRVNPESVKCCMKSNLSMTSKLKKAGDLNIEECGNGLADGGTPIIIKRTHIATLATGQSFFQQPDVERFKRQAKAYGYDVDKYLKAVREVPVVTKEQFKSMLSFLGGIALMITEMGYNNLEIKRKNEELIKEIAERKKTEGDLLLREYQLEILTRTSQHINTVLEVSAILRTLTEASIELVGAKGGAAGVYVNKKMIFTDYCKDGKFQPFNKMFEAGQGVPGWIMKKKRSYICNDVARDERVQGAVKEIPGLYNLVGIPIISHSGELLGCFRIDNKADKKPFDSQDVFVLQGLSASAAIALENAKMLIEHKIAQRRLQIMYDELRSRLER